MALDMSRKRKLDFVYGSENTNTERATKTFLPDIGFQQEYGGYSGGPAKPEEVFIKEETFDEPCYSMQSPAEEWPLDLAPNSRTTRTADTSVKCDFCDYQHPHQFHLTDHRSFREGGFSCNQCNFRCTRKSTLNSHQKSHVVRPRYSCTNCDFQCFRNADLVNHQSIYTCNKRRVVIGSFNIPYF